MQTAEDDYEGWGARKNKYCGRKKETKEAWEMLECGPRTKLCSVPENLARGTDGIENRMAGCSPTVAPFLS
jgi:hypothetical protein